MKTTGLCGKRASHRPIIDGNCNLISDPRKYAARRYLHQKTGRWTSQDPLGFEGGDANLYRYTRNRSVNARDPFGTKDAITIEVKSGDKVAGEININILGGQSIGGQFE